MYLKPPQLPKASILVLEEDSFVRAGLCTSLTTAGYSLAEGSRGANPAERVDLVLTGMGLDQRQRAALELGRAAPVILLADSAAWSALEIFDAADALGAVAVLQRPFSRSALLNLVAEALSQPIRDVAEEEHVELPSLADLLISLHNPNFV